MKAFTWISCILLIVSLGSMLTGCRASDEDQIMEIVRSSTEAYENENIENFIGYLSEDYERRINLSEREPIQVIGKEAMKAALARDFKRWDNIRMVYTDKALKVSGDTAMSSSDYELSMVNVETGDQGVIKGKMTANYRKIDGVWKITKLESTTE